jgi:hypothetical protein
MCSKDVHPLIIVFCFRTRLLEKELSEVCGSPGEVANNPYLGHRLSFKHGAPDDWHFDSEPRKQTGPREGKRDFEIIPLLYPNCFGLQGPQPK